MEQRFLIAENPDPESSLPYLIRLPVGDDHLVLKARETWPRTAKVYCHQADEGWPADPTIVVDVAVRECVRRGVAIDLLLARGNENRSQFVFTRLKGGREGIFWQSARTARKARPSVRVPGRRASGLAEFRITVDTRERYPYKFDKHQATTERGALPVGDYGVIEDGVVVALIERKSLEDLSKGLSDGGLVFQMADLASYPRAAVVVDDRYSSLFKSQYVSGGFLAEVLAQAQARYPNVPVVFCETRPLAEDWVFRFLGACLAAHREQPEDPTAPRE